MVPLFQALTHFEGANESTILCPFLVKLSLVTYVESPGVFEHSLTTMLYSRLLLSRAKRLDVINEGIQKFPLAENYGLREVDLYAINRPQLDFKADDRERLDVCRKMGLSLKIK